MVMILTLTAVFGSEIEASWKGPATLISGSWGSAKDQFGLEMNGDDYYEFPREIIVLPNGDIWIPDGLVNQRLKLYDASGSLKKIISLDIATRTFPEYWFIGQFKAVGTDGLVYMSNYMGKDLYAVYSATGKLLTTTPDRPTEVGTVERVSVGQQHEIKVTYGETVYKIKSKHNFEKFLRDKHGNLYAILPTLVEKYSKRGSLLSRLELPAPVNFAGDDLPIIYLPYLLPLIDLNGNVYRWEATRHSYSIVKWTWVDDHVNSSVAK
jgi:hypothetical protein